MPASSPARCHVLLRTAPALLAALLLSGLGACGPAYRAAAQPSAGPAAAPGLTTAEADPRRLLGSWALTSSSNELFNLLLRPDGKAMAALGSQAEGNGPAERSQLMEVGRWQGWGNGLRVDFSNGWPTRF